jgi:hypothetical protein
MYRTNCLMALIACLATGIARAQTNTISGIVYDHSGRPAGASIRVVDVFGQACHPQNTVFRGTAAGGAFRLEGPPSVYALRFELHDGPPEPWYVKVDSRNGPVAGLAIRGFARTPYASNRPPNAARIIVSEPDANQMVTVRGQAGAVAPSSFVAITTQETGHHAVAEAAADGSFTASIYAPRGHALTVKQDEIGLAWQRGASQCRDATALAAMPGTIVYGAPAMSPSGVPFGTGAALRPLPLYEFSGSIDRNTYAPGERVVIRGTLNVSARAVDTISPLSTSASVRLENVSAAGQIGARAFNQLTSNLMTPTGLPIEHSPLRGPPDMTTEVPLTRTSAGRATGLLDISLLLPATLPAGYYRPRVVFSGPIPFTAGEHDVFQTTDDRRHGDAMLPIIRVGAASPPNIPIVLLMDRFSNGTLGLRAIEDRDRFGVASRIATHADDFTVPRIDELTGEAIRYRLEPFLPSVMLGDGGAPAEPPLIPFKFPSGSLRVTITPPHGSPRTIGPVPFAQARLAAVIDREGNTLDIGGGHLTEPMQLTTLDPQFEVTFDRDGVHRIRVEMTVDDIWGMTWSGDGTFDVHVGRELTLDTAMLPGTPLEVGDALALGATLVPPGPADVEARVTLMPFSDRTRMRQWTRTGRANAFGYARLEPVTFDEPGEYRVDISAVHPGNTSSGARTWGSVVAPRSSSIIAHGGRGIDDVNEPRPQWFFRSALPSKKGSHVPFPFTSGDVTWQESDDSVVPTITFQDVGGIATSVLQGRPNFEDLTSGETVLRIFRSDREDAHLDPSRVDAWLYAYTSVQRPLVRVREEIFDEPPAHGYWRFQEQYSGQIGVGRSGDATNDFKFQFGGIVMRGPLFPSPIYAIYGSLFVLVPAQGGDPGGGTRTFPPFQGNPGPSGGPLFKLKGHDVDLFLHPTGVRPGSVLTRGETATFTGYVAPPLNARVSILVTAPSGATRTVAGRANRVGWFYDPVQDFILSESGVWRAKVLTTFDGQTSAGQVQEPYPTGGVVGSRAGEFFFYVVEPRSPVLHVTTSNRYLIFDKTTATGRLDQLTLTATPPAGLTNLELHYTTTMPGFVIEEGSSASLSYTFDLRNVPDFPNLDRDSNNTPSDVITITLVVSGSDATGGRHHHARQAAVVRGEVLLSGSSAARRRAVVR